jgi:hypothetical protein
MRAQKLLLSAIVAMLCLTAAIAIVVLLSGHFDETSWRVLGTTSAISFFGLLGVPVGVLLERGLAPVLARSSAGSRGRGSPPRHGHADDLTSHKRVDAHRRSADSDGHRGDPDRVQ